MNKILSTVCLTFVLGLAISLILAAPVMWLWNSVLIAAIPSINEIGWLQAWGIMILANILVKGVEVKTKS